MGNTSSSLFDNMLSGRDETFDTYRWSGQRAIPINGEGISHKMTDHTTETVYDLVITKSRTGKVQREEYLTFGGIDIYTTCRDFVIINRDLRDCLRNIEILGSDVRYENQPRLSEQYCLNIFPKLEFGCEKYPLLSELINFIRESCLVFIKMDESIRDGIVPVCALGYYFKIGTKVVITDKETYQGAYIKNVSGSTIHCTTISQDRHGKFSESQICVKLTGLSFTLDQLHSQIRPITEEDDIYQTLKERGAKIVASTGKVQYLNYTGPVYDPDGFRITDRLENARVVLDLLNNIPDSFQEKIRKIASRNTESDYVLPKNLFSILACVPVYYIANGEFILVVFDHLETIQFNENYYEELVLDSRYKEFLLKVASGNRLQIDTIKGKGNCLLFVLSGQPGTGKTMTAEAVSEKNHVPFIVVSFGTLGVTPMAVEDSLQSLMKLAMHWNAILLFDEADVFLEARTNSSDVVRNAIVGVFLQALEYHQGIVFLTTNRETSLDPAILSRAILKIKYTPLTFEQSLIIWETMLRKVTTLEYIPPILNRLQDHLISNGRDIRNILHVASIISQGSPLNSDHIVSAITLYNP